ncbi:hypothetical protein ASZ78_001778 [Callipepla squamata]|uniref:Fibronectin type-III domain-containing protein n=1 Tax=Callipepla squamata TaxID=9009 RepID=A0A226MMJ2_CALSU|nr:hypothetical protein ASZ78_001778 [Callipepla squamata]
MALALPARGGAPDPPGLSCFRRCSSGPFTCSWPPLGPSGSTTYVLVLCYVSRQLCQWHDAGTDTAYTLKRHSVYIHTNTTAWVEARRGQHLQRSPNVTLHLGEAVRLDPPHVGVPLSKANGSLNLLLPRPQCHHKERPPLHREVRFRRVGDRSWTQVMCETGKGEDRRDDSELLESPTLSFKLGQLERNGQRLLQLGWQRARAAQGNVTYTLRARMPACGCVKEDDMVLGLEETKYNLTLCGAAYNIELTATNAAGTSPARRLHVAAEQHTELSFQKLISSGSMVTVHWEAPTRGFALCSERQRVSGASQPGHCVQEEFPVLSSHEQTGTELPGPAAHRWLQPRGDGAAPHVGPLEAPGCYRLAVHGRSAEQDWATFALQHHFVGNTSLSASVHINASADSAVLRWEPTPRSACPGVLRGYRVCHAAEGHNVTYGEVDASATHYALRDLEPGTAYSVGIQELAAGGGGTCSTRWHFHTKALGVGPAVWSSNLKYLGISLGLPAAALIYQLSKKRLHGMLFPPLPKPTGSEALQFSASEMSQVSCSVHPGKSRGAETSQHSAASSPQNKPWKSFLEPSEQLSPGELLVMEMSPEKEAATSTRPRTPQLSPKEPTEPPQPRCDVELPFAYRRQEVLDPEPAGSGGVPSCGPTAPEEDAGSWGLGQALAPLVLLKSIAPQDQEGAGLLQEAVP